MSAIARAFGVTPPAAVIAYAEMWTYQQARHGDQRQDLWIWTAAVGEPAGRRWANFEVGDRSENTFQRLYARLPDAERHRSNAYGVYRAGGRRAVMCWEKVAR